MKDQPVPDSPIQEPIDKLTSDDKVAQRRAKNRIAALHSRKRKKEYVSELENKVDHLESENKRLRAELDILRSQSIIQEDYSSFSENATFEPAVLVWIYTSLQLEMAFLLMVAWTLQYQVSNGMTWLPVRWQQLTLFSTQLKRRIPRPLKISRIPLIHGISLC